MLGLGLALTSQSATSNAAAGSVPTGAVAFYDLLSGAQAGLSKTFTRASTAQRYDETVTLVSTPIDTLRVDHDVTTLAKRGVLLETTSTNSLRNSSGTGAAAGTPGTAPTNWGVTASTAGITRNVSAVGTEDGIPYTEFHFVGTASSTAGFFVAFDSTTQIVAAAGQTWTASAHVRLSAGSASGVYTAIVCSGRTAAGASASDQSEVSFTPTSAALKTQRLLATRAFTGGAVARVYGYIYVSIPNGATVDFKIRVSPQLEQKTTISTVIPTTTVAVTRAADVLTLTPTSGAALTWRARYDDNSTGTIATGVTGAYAVDPATLTRPRVKMIWAATS